MSCCFNFYSLGGIFEKIPNRMLLYFYICQHVASQVVLVVKKLPASVGDERDLGSVLGLGRSPGGGHGNPLQYPCLVNPVDRGAWWAPVHGVAKSQTPLKQFNMHACHASMLSLKNILIFSYIKRVHYYTKKATILELHTLSQVSEKCLLIAGLN